MKIKRAVITAAGSDHIHLPLQTVVNRDGYPQTVLAQLLEEIHSGGVEEAAIIIPPGDQQVYHKATEGAAVKVTLIEQENPRGYGHAVLCAKPFVQDNPFLLMVSDHLYSSDNPEKSCARQLIEVAEKYECAVSAVQATHESNLHFFGTIGGVLYENQRNIYQIDKIVEKPTPTLAEQELVVPGLRRAHYLCFFGMHVLTPTIMQALDERYQSLSEGAKLSLSEVLDAISQKERYFAAELEGNRFDLESRYGLLIAQMALALDGNDREEVLANIIELLAKTKK